MTQFRVGIHVRSVTSDLSQAQTAAVLAALNGSPALRILERRPLREIRITRVIEKTFSGSYDSAVSEIRINSIRRLGLHYGEQFRSGTVSRIAAATLDKVEAMRRTLIHEVAHHLEATGSITVTELVAAAFASEDRHPISIRAGLNAHEYFAENFVAWHVGPDALRSHDPAAYDMIREVLRALL